MSRGKKVVEIGFYDALVEAFRKYPGRPTRVAKVVRGDPRSNFTCSYATAKRAWEKGWPAYGMEAIERVLNIEKIGARKYLAEVRTEKEEDILRSYTNDENIAKEKAREDAIIARHSEGILVRESRKNVIRLLSNSRELLEGFSNFVPKVVAHMNTMDVTDDETVEKSANILWRIAISVSAATNSGLRALQMERLLLGQPTEIIGAKDVEGINESDAIDVMNETVKAIERMQRRKKKKESHLDFEKGDHDD
jgi:hypothetical protein